MEKASSSNTRKPAADQIKCSGYIIDDEAEFALKDLAKAMDALALVFDQQDKQSLDLTGDQFGSILRVFSRATEHIRNESAWTNSAMATPRNLQ